MIKKIFSTLPLFFWLLCDHASFAQNENSKWYFGYGAGLDFMTNPPTVLNNGVSYHYEGSASIADSSGNLLFYTDGNAIYDKSHSTMAGVGNGLSGGFSSTQPALILKKPGSKHIYYVFTVDNNG